MWMVGEKSAIIFLADGLQLLLEVAVIYWSLA